MEIGNCDTLMISQTVIASTCLIIGAIIGFLLQNIRHLIKDKNVSVTDTFTDEEFNVLTQCLDKDALCGDPLYRVMEKRLENITDMEGKIYVYYKDNVLIDIVNFKKEFTNNISFYKGFIYEKQI